MAKKTEKKRVPQCDNCFFHREIGNPSYTKPGVECHREPPKQSGITQRPDPYPFPILPENEWCGEHKPKQEKNHAEEQN